MTSIEIDDPVIARQTPRADFTIDQCWSDYTDEEHTVWNVLYAQQQDLLQERAAPEFIDGLANLELSRSGIPDLARLNPVLRDRTGWQVVMVPHLVPDLVFFDHLANRRFPAGRFIRKRSQLEYLQEPDIFHDIFGHVPMLAHPVFADYMQAYGQGGLRASELGRLDNLARLYWYTVEFGLIDTAEGLRIYGAGIVSSSGESRYALESPEPNRIEFDLDRVMRTKYEIDDYQKSYFVIKSYDQLFAATQKDFGPIYARLSNIETDYRSSDILPEDKIITL